MRSNRHRRRLCGQRHGGYSGDNGPATSATLFSPAGLSVDSSGNLFIADTENSAIRRVDASTGIITTVAGGGTGGDGGPATAAQLFNPCGVRVDSSGNLFISESCITVQGGGASATIMNRIRRVDASSGIITTIAGGPNPGFSGGGGRAVNALPNVPAQLVSPSSSTGTVKFYDGGTLPGAVTAGSGKASLSQVDQAGGAHSIQAVYSGDSVYSASSATLSEVVNH